MIETVELFNQGQSQRVMELTVAMNHDEDDRRPSGIQIRGSGLVKIYIHQSVVH